MTRESNLIKRKPRRAIWKAHIKVRLAPAVYGATAILPKDWMARVHRVQNNNTNGRVGHCLDVLDLFLAKAAVGRDKDRDFCLEYAYLTPAQTLELVPTMPLYDGVQRTLRAMIRNWDKALRDVGHNILQE